MKKYSKIGIALLSMLMALSCFTFVGCGSDDDNASGGDNTNTEQPGDGNTNDDNTDDGNTDDGNATAPNIKEVSIQTGKTSTLSLKRYEQRKLVVNANGTVTWKSSKASVVSVDENGVITTLKQGSATITASVGGKTAKCTVSVKGTMSRSVELTVDDKEIGDEIMLKLGTDETEVSVKAGLKESQEILEGLNFEWESSNENLVTVEDGVITAVSNGTAYVTPSITYCGKEYSGLIKVRVRDWTHENAEMALLKNTANATIEEYSGDVTRLGFEEDTKVQEYTVTKKSTSTTIMATDLLDDNDVFKYERFIFDMSVASTLTDDVVIYNYGKEYTLEGGNVSALGDDLGVIVYNKETGKVHTGALEANKVYTVVLNAKLNKEGATSNKMGLTVEGNATLYIANVVGCASEYYEDVYTNLKKPAEPYTTGIHFVQGEGTSAEKAYVKMTPDADGWVSQTYASTGWDNRIQIGNDEWTDANQYSEMKDRFDYWAAEFKFEGEFKGYIWTAGTAVEFSSERGWTTEEEHGYKPLADNHDWFRIYDEDGKDVTYNAPSTFVAGKVYTIEVKIQKDVTGNVTRGMALNGTGVSGGSTLYMRNPYFLTEATEIDE